MRTACGNAGGCDAGVCLRPAAVTTSSGAAKIRLHQCSYLAVAALARCCSDPASFAGRGPGNRHFFHADGRGPGCRTRPSSDAMRDRWPVTGDTAVTLRERLVRMACDEMPGLLGSLAEGRIEARAQDSDQVCHAPKVDKSEALIDWREGAVQIECKVRAFNDVERLAGGLHLPGTGPGAHLGIPLPAGRSGRGSG